MVRLGQNFLADTNLLDAIVRDAELEPDDVVLEVGAGEGVLTERLAAAAAHVHAVEIDRGLEPALAPLAALPDVELHWGDAMQLDLAGLDPAPTAVVANLPYSIATPLILRTIEQLPSVRRWTVMVQREIADRLRAAPGSRDLRLAERAGAARLRGEAAAHRRPRGLPAAAAGRVGDPRPAPHRPGRRRRPPATSSAPPSPTAASRWRARWSTSAPARSAPPRAALRELGLRRGCPRRGALAREFRRPGGETGRQRVTPAPMRIHAPAKLNLCLFLGPRRDDGLHELCSLFEPLALADAIEISEADRDEVVCPGVEGENLAARALAALRERGWEQPAAADRDREADPGRRRARRRQRRRRRGAAPRAGPARAPTDARPRARSPPSWAPTSPRSSPRARPRARGRRASRAPARPQPPTRSCCYPPAAVSAPPPSSPRPTGSDSAAARRSWTSWRRRLREAAGGGASPLDYADLLANDLEPAARSLRPDIGDALDALREAGAPLAFMSGSGPTAVGLFPDPGGGKAAAAQLDRDDAIVCEAGRETAPVKLQLPENRRRRRLLIVADRRRDRRRLLPAQPGDPARRTPAAAGGRLQHARRLDLPAGRRLRLRRDRRLRRPRRPRRDGDAARRRRRRPGRDQTSTC